MMFVFVDCRENGTGGIIRKSDFSVPKTPQSTKMNENKKNIFIYEL